MDPSGRILALCGTFGGGYARLRFMTQPITLFSMKLLVTSALPYANGPIHLGHLVEVIQTDVFVRFQKMMGHECVYVCADDTHGTPIMLAARTKGISPQELVASVRQDHMRDFASFNIQFDWYGSTDSVANHRMVHHIYAAAQQQGVISSTSVRQLYCDHDAMFLPDRMVKGHCPRCGVPDQYGDSCEQCGATYSPMELSHPVCTLCGASPIWRDSDHLLFNLQAFQPLLETWVPEHVPPAVANKLAEWFEVGLKPWDISRDAPYFGFEIPGHPTKYFYVWMDAPIGYIAATQEWAEQKGQSGLDWWTDPAVQIHHFIGKDILYFHTLFWPAMLQVAGFQLPHRVHVHGFLTINGHKMSKSRGSFITAESFAQHHPPDYLRYYLASKLTPSVDDIDFNPADFMAKVNAEVVNKVVNIASRLIGLVIKISGGALCDTPSHPLLDRLFPYLEDIATHYQQTDTLKATRLMMQMADMINEYIDHAAPWALLKTEPDAALEVCSVGLNGLRLVVLALQPIMPTITMALSRLWGDDRPYQWHDAATLLGSHTMVQPYTAHVATRLTPADLEWLAVPQST